MPTAPHIQAVLDRIDGEMARAHLAAKRFHVFDGAARYVATPQVRERTLQRLEIADGASVYVIAQAKTLLSLDSETRRYRPLWAQARIHRWALLAVWIGERRLARANAANQMHFSRRFQLAAE